MGQITPETLAASGTEHGHQAALFCWAASEPGTQLKFMFAIPNGGERAPVTASRLKAEGVKSGVLDIFLPYPIRPHHGLFIEMKIKPKKPTDNQIKFARQMRMQGYKTALCYTWEEGREAIRRYLRGLILSELDFPGE